MTPELELALVTPDCAAYRQKPEKFPFQEPYWAFYWPGGQVLTRYILDSGEKWTGNTLDFGCGCGSASLAILKVSSEANVTAGPY